MEALLRLWHTFEQYPWDEALLATWHEAYSDDLSLLRPALSVTGELAEWYPCPERVGSGCPRRVFEVEPGVYEAVCGNVPSECARVLLQKSELALLRLDRQAALRPLLNELCRREALAPIDVPSLDGFLPVGLLARRYGSALVTLATGAAALHVGAALELARRAQADAAIVLVIGARSDLRTAEKVATLGVEPGGDLGLWRGLRLLWPETWERRATDKESLFEDATLELGTTAAGHVVRLNGATVHAFEGSDLKFLRLLVLAAGRAQDMDADAGGWVRKALLELDDKEEDLADLRRGFTHDLPTNFAQLTPAERKALVSASARQTGQVRLALHPARVRLDPSLADFRLLSVPPDAVGGAAPGKRASKGQAALVKDRAQATARALKLVEQARRFGAPLPSASALRNQDGSSPPQRDRT
jgi:hypothetical protein